MNGLRTRNENRTHLLTAQTRPRSPAFVYTVVTVALAVLVGTLALASRQTPPPTIAEFAPQAVEQITDLSSDATASRGSASGETSAIDEQAGTNDATEQTIDVARVRRCVGDPPRQIEDPQSPPCVPYWSGDNGGATAHGVTRNEIRVADSLFVPMWSQALVTFFNKRFEFYGRQIRLISRDPGDSDPAAQRAAARAAYEEDQAFASNWVACDSCQTYFDELARLGVVGVDYNPTFPETYLAAHRPYMWTYPMANDRLFATTGNWYCARFAGRNAVHAGDPVLQMTRRKPGIVLTEAGPEGTSAEPMNAQLASCGARTNAVIHGTEQTYDFAYYAAFMENAMLQMKTSGVTTVACLCAPWWLGLAMRAATNQGYFPEWLLTSYIATHSMYLMRLWAGETEQLKSLMRLATQPMHRPCADHASVWAIQDVSKTGCAPGTDSQWNLDTAYWGLLVLASGMQMAGPNLTPETFERGLHQARFPNPAHSIMAGSVGFTDGDHSMTDDAVEAWWSNTAQSPDADQGLGTYCYVDHGARRRIGNFPTDDPFFQGPCDNGTN